MRLLNFFFETVVETNWLFFFEKKFILFGNIYKLSLFSMQCSKHKQQIYWFNIQARAVSVLNSFKKSLWRILSQEAK